MSFALPKYLSYLPVDNPSFLALNSSLHDFGIRQVGKGGFLDAAVVEFTQPHDVFRIYGGEANQCGFWWNLDPPQGNTTSYFTEFAVCHEWNDATNMIKCKVPVGFTATVGTGQSATCADNSTIMPDQIVLQLNSEGICSIANMVGEGLTCEWCATHQFSLGTSACATVDTLNTSGSSKTAGGVCAWFGAMVLALMLGLGPCRQRLRCLGERMSSLIPCYPITN